ncbi:RGLG [Balamuthia mandrillaris]
MEELLHGLLQSFWTAFQYVLLVLQLFLSVVIGVITLCYFFPDRFFSPSSLSSASSSPAASSPTGMADGEREGRPASSWLNRLLYQLVGRLVDSGDDPFAETEEKENFVPIEDDFSSIKEVQDALRQAGLTTASLVLGIDYSKSNIYTGRRTFAANCLHDVKPRGSFPSFNPYQEVIAIVGQTLEPFDEDKLIPCFGFGDQRSGSDKVFPFYENRVCDGIEDVLQRYNQLTPTVILAGPTSFAPLVYETIRIVRELKEYHILVIITDGQVVCEQETREAIVTASNYPLSIIAIGVGDGPWDLMHEFDDELPKRRFDNFQFVNYSEVKEKWQRTGESDFAPTFALHALMEIPQQYKEIQRLGLLPAAAELSS